MALTKVSSGVRTLATDEVGATQIAAGAVGASEIASTIDLSSKTVTLPAASVTAHASDTDLSPVRNDIATLALHSAIADNKAAYNLSNAFIDQFEDDTGIHVETTCDRDSSAEFMASITREVGTAVWVTGDRTGTITATDPEIGWLYSVANFFDGSTTNNLNDATYPASIQTITDQTILHLDLGAASTSVIRNLRVTATQANTAATGTVKYQGSADNSSWTDISGTMASWGINPGQPATVEFGDSTLTANTVHYRYFRIYGVSGNITNSGWWAELELKESPVTGSTNASGNYTSTTQTSLASVSTMGIVVLYKNNEGTATLNTDLVVEVSANGGTNYSSATLVAGGTFSSGINIAAVSGVSVTAGTAPKYKISFANQATDTKETQVHGVALLY